jgi:L-rhamnose mutarotase
MIYRRVWTMELRHGFESEYDKAHAAIWPELADQMVADGIVSFQLYRVGVTIFATQERDSEFADAKPPPSGGH